MAGHRGRSIRAESHGHTVVELIIALTMGAVILAAVMGFLVANMRNIGGSEIREDFERNTRYVGILLRRDLQLTGVGIESTPDFGTLSAWPGTRGDTLSILHLPYAPSLATPYSIDPTANGGLDPAAGTGTCGSRCLDLLAADTVPLDIGVGDLARLQIETTRRLIMVSDISRTSPTQIRLQFTEADTLLRRPAGFSGGVQLSLNGSFVQRLESIVYYIDDEDRLLRARALDIAGRPQGEVVAYGIEDFQANLRFTDGDELERAIPSDSDPSNDFDDIMAVRVRVSVRAERADPRVNGGQLLRDTVEWMVTPRNLRYEKNRI